MPRNIAVLVKEESQAAQGLLQAFAQEGNEVTCIVCDELLPVALQMAHPDFAVVASGDVWGQPGDVQGLLDALGVPYLGSDGAAIARCRDASQLSGLLREAVAQGQLDSEPLDTLVLGRAALDALSQTGRLDAVFERLGRDAPLEVRGNGAPLLERGRVVRDVKELSEALADLKKAYAQIVVRPHVAGCETIVPILGETSNILIAPPAEVCEGEGDGAWHVPVRMASLADDEQDAQAIRSEVERCALDAFIVCGCKDFACVRVVWDGGCARVLDVDAAPSLAQGSPLMEALTAAQENLAELANEFCEIADERLC